MRHVTMAILVFLALLGVGLHDSAAVKHSLKYFEAGSSGVSDLPEFMGVAVFDGVLLGYCDSNIQKVEAKQDWVEKVLENDPHQLQYYNHECFQYLPNVFKDRIHFFKQHFNQIGGVHVLQRIIGCEWDEETGEFKGFSQYGYDGEDFMTFDLKTLTWSALKPKAVTIKQRWDADKPRAKNNQIYLTQLCPEWLKMYLDFGRMNQRTVLPSVSLLQKTPSSPVSCHATGFYPDRAMMFWRKDGEELHEDVDHGEILPNNNGSFQMSVDLKPPSVTPEDWRRYDCVFQLAGENVVTKLDKAAIRTNWGILVRNDKNGSSNITILITAAVVVLAVVLFAVVGFAVYKKRKANCPPPAPVDSSELSERLKPET